MNKIVPLAGGNTQFSEVLRPRAMAVDWYSNPTIDARGLTYIQPKPPYIKVSNPQLSNQGGFVIHSTRDIIAVSNKG